jgi:L-aspartate oxidase
VPDDANRADGRLGGLNCGGHRWVRRSVDRTAGPQSAIGSGCAIAYRAGAALADLEFVQFHPTALDQPGRPAFLLSEALRGAGAQLINSRGERFMPSIHPDAELAPRDIVARAVAHECRSGPVFLSLSHLDPLKIHARFPNLSRRLAHRGLDLAVDLLPVRPAAHFSIGGILVDRDGRTTLPGLFAVGEVACSGLHGANRLASNALGECLVFGTRGGYEAARSVAARRDGRPEPSFEPPAGIEARRAPLALRSSMTEFAGIERSGHGLHHLRNWLEQHLPTGTSWETRTPDAWLISTLIAQAALVRAESRGSHYRIDYPAPSPDMVGRFVHRRGEPLEFRPISHLGSSIGPPAFQEVIR